MIEIVPIQGVREHTLRLGEITVFRIHRRKPSIEIRWFMHFGNILQTQPMSEWTHGLEEVEWLPESPGHYRLAVQWREGEQSGWVSYAFEAQPNVFSARPSRVSRGRRGRFWAPNEYEAKGVAQYETALFDRLPGLVQPGSVVYDVGANIGLFTVPFSRRVGPTGRVVCFEPNPICVQFLKANLEVNACANARIVPVALAEHHQQVPFTLNFGNSLLGLTSISSFYHQKAGQAITVEGRPLDELRSTFELPAPDLVKMDVEGAEGAVVRGMARTLAEHRPVLLMEIHGAGACRELAAVLDPLGYGYQEATDGKVYAGSEELASDLEKGPVVRQLICKV